MTSKNILKPCNIYLALWMIYNLQGVLYSSGGIISVSILAVLIVWSIYHMIQCLLWKNKPVYFRGLTLLVLMFTFYGLTLIVSGSELYVTEGAARKVRNYQYLKDIYASLLPVYSCYYFTRTGKLDLALLKKWFWVFLVVVLVQYFRVKREGIAAMLERGSRADGITNNAGYIFLSLLPCIYLLKEKKFLQYAFLILCMVFIILAMKRGAMLIGIVAALFFLWDNLKNASRGAKIKVILAIVLVSGAAYALVNYMLDTSDYFNTRMQKTMEGDDSNRSIMYASLWETFLNDSNPFQMLFGRGALGTLTVSFNYAHNDWLEILINQGILGICLFINYWICFFRSTRSGYLGKEERNVMTMLLIIFAMKTIFSMSYATMPIYSTCILGFALAGGFTRSKIA